MPKAIPHFPPAETEVINLLAQLVATESCDPPGRELPIARVVQTYLQTQGIDPEVDEFSPGRANVLARLKGTGGRPALVFSAHLDTVPAGRQSWTHPPFSAIQKDGRLYGRGAADMKSALAAMLVVFVSYARRTQRLAGDLILAISAGESSNCLGAKRFAERGDLPHGGMLLVGEPTSLDVVTAEMAVLWLRIAAHGVIGHVSGGGGDNAIIGLMDFLAPLSAGILPSPPHSLLPEPSLLIGKINGGSAINVTPDLCEADLDIRLRPGTTAEEVIDLLHESTTSKVSISVLDFKPAVETPADHPFVATCLSACAAVRGRSSSVAGVSYYSDATVLAKAFGLPFAIIGPGELGMSGRPDEYVETARVHDAVAIYHRIVADWMSA